MRSVSGNNRGKFIALKPFITGALSIDLDQESRDAVNGPLTD
jgi:hypothetical protein